MLESYFLFKQMTGRATKAKRNAVSACKGCVMRNHSSQIPRHVILIHMALSGIRVHFAGCGERDRTEKKGLHGGVRGTLGEKGVPGSQQRLSAKRGACEGKAEAAIPALGWYHVKLFASSLFLLRGFVSHANSGSGPNSGGQAVHPNWQGREKKGGRGRGGSKGRGRKGIARREGSGHVQNASSFRPLMSCLCPPWESSGGTKAPLSLPHPSAVSFSRMNESFRSGGPLCPIIDGDYPDFMQPSQCEEVP